MGGVAISIVLLFLALAVLWARNLVYGRRGVALRADVLHQSLGIGAWTGLLLGVLGGLLATAGGMSFFLWLPCLILVGMLVYRLRLFDQYAVIWSLLSAMRIGGSLAETADALSYDLRGESGRRARRLAEHLAAGIPLRAALRDSGYRLPLELDLATCTLDAGNPPAPLLERLLPNQERFWSVLQSFTAKFAYVGWIWLHALVILAFVYIRVMPGVVAAFGTMNPTMVQQQTAINVPLRLLHDPNWYITFGLLGILGAGCSAGLLFLALLHYLGWTRWEPPIIRGLWQRVHGAIILRNLADRVELGQPLPATLRHLADEYPRPHIRLALDAVVIGVQNGEPWHATLAHEGLIRRADAALFETTEQRDQLPWAMRLVADHVLRQFELWTRHITNAIFLLTIVLLAIPVSMIGFIMFSLLTQTIQNLA